MNSIKWRIFIFLSSVVFFILYFKKQESLNPVTEVSKKELVRSIKDTESNLTSTKASSKIIVKNKGEEVAVSSPVESKNQKKLLFKPSQKKEKSFDPLHEINFKIIEGYAVASEDLILGKPKDESVKSGPTEWPSEDIPLWENAEVPFAFDVNLPEFLKQRALEALESFSKKTNIKFFPYSGDEKDFIVFSKSKELCASYVGRIGGAQPIFLKSDCGVSEIKHEIMHALGFIHEHQREIRDQYISVLLNNVKKENLINFDILPKPFQRVYKNSEEGIDFKSLMIYPSNAFVTHPNLNSILVKNSNVKISENMELSDGDLEKINNLYFRKF